MVKGRWTWLGAAFLAAGATACGTEVEDLFPNYGTGGAGGAGGFLPTSSGTGASGGAGGAGASGGGSAVSGGVDLRADVNRDGTVDLDDPADDTDEDTWDASHGAIFLANIDDDLQTCPTAASVSNADLAACNDAADEVVNGEDDLLDLARLRVAPWPEMPVDVARVTVTPDANATGRVRIFKATPTGFQALDEDGALSLDDLKEGVELAIEAKNFVRNAATWEGFADITLRVEGDTWEAPITDTVRMRVAPLLLRHHLDPAQQAYVTRTDGSGSTVFRAGLAEAVQAAGVPVATREFTVSDQWTQDFFETGYMAMPGPGGQKHTIHVNVRSANYSSGGNLRSAGRVVFTQLRGKDVAGAAQYDPNHPNSMDSLNSFGNTETIPPYTLAGQTYPVGRILRGKTASFYPDESFDTMLTSQGYQSPVYIDTEWLSVGHVDETTSFVKAPNARGWVLVLADPAMGVQMLEDAAAAGNGDVDMFVAKGNARISISEVLDDPDLMNTSAWAAAEIDGQREVLVQETGLAEAEIIRIGSIFESQGGYAVAYVPGMVNGIYLSDTHFAAPNPFGPQIGGQDLFKQQMISAFTPLGITLHWIDNWSLYHLLSGEVHCGTNTTRAIPAFNWWEAEQ
ncbi:protein-arginine deiminase family protein [Chondromyces apiculatus]|uniref:Protein-arginine deiminase C-terminal domain-containing protein n=1 Tax=Chondromyces apiculatus DSM 436 TaxID=1192034 RepID=A0A017SVG3_9BACT|nr:protein-arginine deiminase family protein [Chondromyces apiculatus]EYF00959.1 Hypothetical protein CAP_8827 [Chondromyces apiculatus DSM 436]